MVDRGPIVEIQPNYLFRAYWSIAVRGLKLGMVAVLGQDIFCPVRGRDYGTTMWPRKTLVPGEHSNGDQTDHENCYILVSQDFFPTRRTLRLIQILRAAGIQSLCSQGAIRNILSIQ